MKKSRLALIIVVVAGITTVGGVALRRTLGSRGKSATHPDTPSKTSTDASTSQLAGHSSKPTPSSQPDPAKTLHELQSRFKGNQKLNRVRDFFTDLAVTQFDVALELFKTLPNGPLRDDIYGVILAKASTGNFLANLPWFEKEAVDPYQTLRFTVRTQTDKLTQPQLLEMMGAGHHEKFRAAATASMAKGISAAQNPVAFFAQGAQIDASLLGAYLMGGVSNLPKSGDTLTAFASSSLSPEQKVTYLPRIVVPLVETDPLAAEVPITSLPDNGLRESAISTWIGTWLRSEPIACSEHVAKMPLGKMRDVASAKLAEYSFAQGDPEAGNTWRSAISDPKIRQSVRDTR